MPTLFNTSGPTGYAMATGRVANTYDEALKRAQELQKLTGVRLYVQPLSTGGYRLVTGRIPGGLSEANRLAQEWARYGVMYLAPLYSPANPAQEYQRAAQTVFNQIFDRLQQPFNYNPANDPVFQTASQAAQRQVMEAMNERGILNSTITAERAAQAVGELAAQFMEQAFQRRMAEVESLANLLSPLINQTQFERSFPLAESEVTGRYGGQPTQQVQRDQISAVLDLLRLLPFIPRGIGSAVPGPLGEILNRLQNTRLTLGNLLP